MAMEEAMEEIVEEVMEEAMEEAMEAVMEEAKPTTIHPHPPHHHPAMISSLYSLLKSHNKKNTDHWFEMRPKCA